MAPPGCRRAAGAPPPAPANCAAGADRPAQAAPALPAPAFAVRRLALTAFRSWRSARLEVPAASVVLTGANGAGKTNLLEALSLLAPGRGLRRAPLAQLQHRAGSGPAGAADWAVSAWVDSADGPRRIGTGRDPGNDAGDGAKDDPATAGRRIVRIDGVPAQSQADLSALGAVAWLTPEMDGLFAGPAGARRRFLDRLVAGFLPRHATRLAAYSKAMRERNRLLRDGTPDPAWLDALEATMAEQGIAVAAARADFVARLVAACAARVSAFPVPDLGLAWATDGEGDGAAGAPDAAPDAVPAWADAGVPSLVAEEALRARLRAGRGADAAAGRALAGPHRMDLAVRFAARDMPAATCSTGEQKALLIALILAAARLQAIGRGAAPLLLLDEVAAHLDGGRRAALFDEIEQLGCQAWMTGTDAGLFEALRGRASFVAVADGALAPAGGPDAATGGVA